MLGLPLMTVLSLAQLYAGRGGCDSCQTRGRSVTTSGDPAIDVLDRNIDCQSREANMLITFLDDLRLLGKSAVGALPDPDPWLVR
jgi:hypothetical protein